MKNLSGANNRIGLMCGTFNPPHIGHLILAQSALIELKLDFVLFLPVGDPTHKHTQTAAVHRLKMTELAIADNPAFQLDTTDAIRPPPHYTATLIPLVQEKFPNADLWLIIGGDSLNTFPDWYQPEQILAQCRLALLDRPEYDTEIPLSEPLANTISSKIDRLTGASISLSSTLVRQRYAENSPTRYLIHPAVDDYIRDQKLYRK